MESENPVLSIDNQILGDLINGVKSNPVGNYGILDLIRKHIQEGGKTVLYDKLTGKITYKVTLDDNTNFKFTNY